MTRTRFRAVAVALLFASSLYAAPRRRAAAPPVETPADWLSRHAIPLATTEAVGSLDDLAPLATIVGNAHVVGLGDATHGTHEFFTTKLRIIQFLVTKMGFDVLAMEHSYAQTERINAYVQGGPGDPKQLLQPQNDEIPYWMWQTDEFVAVIEWLRNYNMTRGSKPPVVIFGADVYDGRSAADLVIKYLNTVDPAAAATATNAYRCVANQLPSGCSINGSDLKTAQRLLTSNESIYTARSSPQAFADALHAQNVISESVVSSGPLRDVGMGNNVAWAKDHRGTAGKVIYWAHNEHVTRGPSVYGVVTPNTAGTVLAQTFGSDYVNIGSATYAGQFLFKSYIANALLTPTLTPANADDYETFLHASAAPNIIVPLHDPPPFLATSHHMREAGTGEINGVATNGDFLVNLPQRFDAITFIDQTTANHPLQ
jgi:erythromycin esterase